MAPMKIKFVQAFGALCQETCVILYWLGLWSLINLTSLVRSIPFCLFCLIGGGLGIFIVNAFAPALILSSIEESAHHTNQYLPTPGTLKKTLQVIRLT